MNNVLSIDLGTTSVKIIVWSCNESSYQRIHTGFGCATLFWLSRYKPDFLRNFDHCGTIGDFLATVLTCHAGKPHITVQNAASWGYVDHNGGWNHDILEVSRFPSTLLPNIVESGENAGALATPFYNVPQNSIVFCALGDTQCSIFSKLSPKTAVLNIGTSSQIAFVLHEDFTPPKVHPALSGDFMSNQQLSESAVTYFPYFHDRYLAVAASLNGGNVVMEFARVLSGWISEITGEFDSTIDVNRVCEHFDRIIESSSLESTVNDDDLRIIPTFYGERHYPNCRMSIENIGPKSDFALKFFLPKLLMSLMDNLNRMVPEEYLVKNGVENFKLTGRKSFLPILCQFAAKIYPNLNVVAENAEDFGGFDAAYGCALYITSQHDNACVFAEC